MALTKQAININFSSGLDTKTDPYQVQLGKFLELENSVFTKGGLLQKRNGYAQLPALPDTSSSYLNTFNANLTAIGNNLEAFAEGPQQWVSRGEIQPLQLSTLPLIRNNLNQYQVDTAFSSSGLVCTVYTTLNPSNLSAFIFMYSVADSTTGQTIVAPTVITNANAVYGFPRVFVLGPYFIIVYTGEVISTYHLQYIALSTLTPSIVTSPVDISTDYMPSVQVNFDGVVYNNSLYIAWNGASSSGIMMSFLTSNLSLSSAVNPDPTHTATLMSVTADAINGTIWVSYYSSATSNGYSFAVSPILATILGPTATIVGLTVVNLTSTAVNNPGSSGNSLLTFLFELSQTYSYDSSINTDYININTLTQAGVVGTASTIKRSVGLASKGFYIGSTGYFLCEYQSPYQPTYYLSDYSGNIISQLAYSNGAGPEAADTGYLPYGLPSVTVNGDTAQVGYLIKDLITAANTNTNVPSGTQVDGVYTQTGINLASFTLGSSSLITAEIGTNLNITGGFLWAYDGYLPVENGFFLYPDSVEVAESGTSGSMGPGTYFYRVTYEWTDNQGNLFRSAPSLPVEVTLNSDTSVTVNVPTLRLTYKIANPVKSVIYRWSNSQQIYYQTTSVVMPILNSITTDSITFTDINSDATILGNSILYTTGGVLENIGGPGFDSVFLFDNRLWGINSENKNLLWYSKLVIQSVPVEMSDLLTIFVAPSLGASGSAEPLRCGISLDDKLILFKASAIVYINGSGPDSTGANSQYSEPIFITSTVGCSNQNSIVFIPQGLMFEFDSPSGNQIWLLGRDLSTQYIGAPVESITINQTIKSSVNIPGTNEVRFSLNNGVTLTYDYYYGQWNTFGNVPAISSTLFEGLHTYVNSLGQVFQESPGSYVDVDKPVLMSFTTSWINLAGLQGYQRAYYFYLLGTYQSPHLLTLQIAYDYNPALVQTSIINPSNFSPVYGQDLNYGSGTPYGGAAKLEQWRVFLARQRCESFQITVNEVYNPGYGVAASAGLTISGLCLVVGIKRGFRPITASHSVG